MLRLIINKAKAHYNDAVENARQEHYYEALGDLDAALELDSQLADAHVLRGTILARLERLEEAREAWERAIALDPQTAKAYQYMEQVGEVKGAAPVIRRARKAIVVSAGLVLLSLLGSVVLIAGMRDPDAKTFQSAWTALESGDLMGARNLARELRSPDRRDALEGALRGELAGRLAEASRLARSGEKERALSRLRDLAAHPVSPDTQAMIEAEIAVVRAGYFDRQREWMTRERVDVPTLRGFHAVNTEIRRLFPSHIPDADLAREQIASRFRKQVTNDLSPVLTLLGNAANAPTIDARLHVYTEFIDQDDAFISELIEGTPLPKVRERWAQALVEWSTSAAGEGRRGEWRDHLDRLRVWGAAEQFAQVRETEALLTEFEQRDARLALDEAIASGDPESIVAAGDRAADHGVVLTSGQSRRIHLAREALAIGAYYSLMDLADRIERLDLGREEALEVLRLVRHAEGPLPPRIRSRAEENIRFFALQAARLLEDEDAALREYYHLVARDAQSPYLLLLEKQGYTPNG